MGMAAGIATGEGTSLEKLNRIYRSHVALIGANPGLPRFIFSEEIHLENLQLAEAIAGKMAGYIETLSTVIGAGIKHGELRSLSPRETAITLLGMIQFTALRWSITRGAFSLNGETGRLWSNFLLLVQAPSSPAAEETNPMEPV
jgi:hypothetical protein